MNVDDLIAKQEKAHTGRAARKKGLNWQNEIAKVLTNTIAQGFNNFKFISTSQSGSWATKNKQEQMAGDIIFPMNDIWFIECKFLKKFSLESIFNNDSVLYTLWDQCIKNKPKNKLPILLIKKDKNRIYFVTTQEILKKFSTFDGVVAKFFLEREKNICVVNFYEFIEKCSPHTWIMKWEAFENY